MPATISPKKERRQNGVYWVVSLGKKCTGTSRQRHYFATRKDAISFVKMAEESRHRLGCEAFILPITLRVEALACTQRLKPLNTTLTQAVEFFIRNVPRAESAKSIEELKEEFIKSRKAMNCRPRTIVPAAPASTSPRAVRRSIAAISTRRSRSSSMLYSSSPTRRMRSSHSARRSRNAAMSTERWPRTGQPFG